MISILKKILSFQGLYLMDFFMKIKIKVESIMQLQAVIIDSIEDAKLTKINYY